MESYPTPMFENERQGLGRECEAASIVAAIQAAIIVRENVIIDYDEVITK